MENGNSECNSEKKNGDIKVVTVFDPSKTCKWTTHGHKETLSVTLNSIKILIESNRNVLMMGDLSSVEVQWELFEAEGNTQGSRLTE